jgi:hypothetical protein
MESLCPDLIVEETSQDSKEVSSTIEIFIIRSEIKEGVC